MNHYPRNMIEALMDVNPDSWQEITLPCRYDRVYVYNLPEEKIGGEPYESIECYGKIVKFLIPDVEIGKKMKKTGTRLKRA